MSQVSPDYEGLRRALGRRIAVLRKKGPLGRMTQQQLADRVDISKSYLEKIESGERSATIEIIASLAAVFGVTSQDLLCDDAKFLRRGLVARFEGMLARLRPDPAFVERFLALMESTFQGLDELRSSPRDKPGAEG